MGRKKRPENENRPTKLTRRQKFAAIMLAHGRSKTYVAKHVDVHTSAPTLRKWMDDPEFLKLLHEEQDRLITEFKHKATALCIDSAMKAFRVYRNQLKEYDPVTEEPNGPYLRQNAARELLSRGMALIEATEDKAIEVHFVGMPQLGSPPTDEVVPDEGSNAINRLLSDK